MDLSPFLIPFLIRDAPAITPAVFKGFEGKLEPGENPGLNGFNFEFRFGKFILKPGINQPGKPDDKSPEGGIFFGIEPFYRPSPEKPKFLPNELDGIHRNDEEYFRKFPSPPKQPPMIPTPWHDPKTVFPII